METLRILSRASALAVGQAREVAAAIAARWPGIRVTFLTRPSAGDRNRDAALSALGDKGLFTADLSDALVSELADLVVHSWKDLPIEARPDTVVAGTLPRADVRDVLLVARPVVARRPSELTVLTSSPRRAWQLTTGVATFLPWAVERVSAVPVRGNVPTRLAKLVAGEADALVVAKAALDRLLGTDVDARVPVDIRRALDRTCWMVLPVSRFPAAPAQGALAIEVAAGHTRVLEMVRAISHTPTERACLDERRILAAHGGGCHEAIGVTILERDYGRLTSISGRLPDGRTLGQWSLERASRPAVPAAALATIWPRPDERGGSTRRSLSHAGPLDGDLWITRADALPAGARPGASQLVWAAGTTTWTRLAAQGVWVNGCADGLGDEEDPDLARLAGRNLAWRRLSHTRSGDGSATATYEVTYDLPDDLAARTHFFWTSGSAFLEAVARFPAIRAGWHASGPGRTARVIASALDAPERASIWLDYDAWLSTLTR